MKTAPVPCGLALTGGLDKFDRQTEQFTHYQYDAKDPQSLAFNHEEHLNRREKKFARN